MEKQIHFRWRVFLASAACIAGGGALAAYAAVKSPWAATTLFWTGFTVAMLGIALTAFFFPQGQRCRLCNTRVPEKHPLCSECQLLAG